MKCQECKELLHPYLDGEIDSAQRAAVDAHLKTCADCRRNLSQLQALQRALQSPALRQAASETLRQRIQVKLREADARERRPAWPRWAAAAAVVVLAAGLGWKFLPLGQGDADDVMVDAVVDQLELALKSNHLTEFNSSNPSKIEVWFSARLPYTPAATDYSAQGYKLMGARITQVEEQPAAVLVYQHDSDLISVYVCPAQKSGKADMDSDQEDGYNVVYWTQGNLSYWVVGKSDPAVLKQLGAHLRHVG